MRAILGFRGLLFCYGGGEVWRVNHVLSLVLRDGTVDEWDGYLTLVTSLDNLLVLIGNCDMVSSMGSLQLLSNTRD